MTKDTKELGLVLYGDGSARPNPGFTGSGVHAYYFDLDDNKLKSDKLDGYFTTDKGYQKNKEGANDCANGELTGVPVKPLEYVEVAISHENISTNNFAELSAVLEGLKACYKESVKFINIICDSEYTLNVIKRDMHTWANNNWYTAAGKPVSNVSTIKELYLFINNLKSCGVKISASWVRGHSDIAGNTQADILSNVARSKAMVKEYGMDVQVYTPKEYIDPKDERHPLLSHNRVYFISKEDKNIPGYYFQGESGAGDFMIGKRLPETGYSVLILKEPDPLIESMKKIQYSYACGITQIAALMLDRIYNKRVINYVQRYGIHSTEKDKRTNAINFLDGKPLSLIMNPTGLSIRAIECFNILSDVLKVYINNKSTIETTEVESYRYTVRDITDIFYDITTKTHNKQEITKYTLKKEYANGAKNVVLDHKVSFNKEMKDIKIPLIFKTDLPDRNRIKRLESLHPRIKLITWRYSEETVNYSIIIDTDDSIGVWSNFYSDQIVIM